MYNNNTTVFTLIINIIINRDVTGALTAGGGYHSSYVLIIQYLNISSSAALSSGGDLLQKENQHGSIFPVVMPITKHHSHMLRLHIPVYVLRNYTRFHEPRNDLGIRMTITCCHGYQDFQYETSPTAFEHCLSQFFSFPELDENIL